MKRLGTRTLGVGVAAVWTLGALAGAAAWAQQQGGGIVYRCPGPPVLYTDALTPAEAQQRGCRTIEGAPISVMPSTPRPRPDAAPAAAPAAAPPASAPRPAGSRVDPAEQRSRDSDRRAILEAELRREQQRLAELQREYNNGQPERRGDERNFQRYLDRVAEMKAGIERKEGDIAAIKRELGKLPN